jgi:hypothetical protein
LWRNSKNVKLSDVQSENLDCLPSKTVKISSKIEVFKSLRQKWKKFRQFYLVLDEMRRGFDASAAGLRVAGKLGRVI